MFKEKLVQGDGSKLWSKSFALSSLTSVPRIDYLVSRTLLEMLGCGRQAKLGGKGEEK